MFLVQALIEEYQTDELLFDVEFRHPWCRVDFCSVNRIDYHEITENQIENGLENQKLERKDKTQNKFLGLGEGEKKDGVEVMKIMKDTVFISYNGILQELTFKQNSLPSLVTKAATKQKTKDKREEHGERGRSSSSSQRASKAPSRPSEPQVVTVPSRRPQIDPRIIEKGLEYLSKTEDNEKREYLLKRLESLQSGQSKIKSDIDNNERRRQHDEWRKSREKGR